MRSFADLLETTAAASTSDAARNLTALASVKAGLQITTTDADALIDDLIPRVTQLVVDHCRLAQDNSGNVPTFARETLRATWYVDDGGRDEELLLPWRVPLYSIDSVVEDGAALVAGTDFLQVGKRAGKLRRLSGDRATCWSANKIVVTFKAGFAATLSTTVDQALEAAMIEQLRGMVFAAGRDPNVRSENMPDVGSVSYTTPGGDTLGALSAPALSPAVRAMLQPWRNPAP